MTSNKPNGLYIAYKNRKIKNHYFLLMLLRLHLFHHRLSFLVSIFSHIL